MGGINFKRFLRPQIAAALCAVVGMIASGCLNNGATPSALSNGLSTGSVGTSVVGANTSSETQCTVFNNNAQDYQSCLSCKQSLCPCTTYDPIRTTLCLTTNITSCTLDMNQLVSCVHNNQISS